MLECIWPDTRPREELGAGVNTSFVSVIASCCRLTKDAVNLLLVEIGMVLRYHEHLLEADNSSNSDGMNDSVWEGPWVDSALLSSSDSDISGFPGSDNSTHCGVLSAAASAAAYSNASSMTNMSDDDGASEAEHSTYARTQHASGSPNDSLMESLWRSGSGPMGPQRPADHPPFTHPLYVAHMVRTAKKLVGLCQLVELPALLEQVGTCPALLPSACGQNIAHLAACKA